MRELFTSLSKEKRHVLLVCCLAMLGNGFLSLSMGSILPDMKLSYGLTDTQSGILLSAHSLGNLASGFISAVLFMRIGEQRGILLLASVAYIGFFMSTLCGAPVYLTVCFMLLGFGRGSVTNYTTTAVNRISDGSPVGANMLHSGFAVGAIATPMLYLLLSKLMGWRLHVWAVALYGVVLIVLLSRIQPHTGAARTEDARSESLSFLKKPTYLLSVMMLFFYLCSEYAVNGFLVTYIQHKQTLLLSLTASGQTLKAFSQQMATLMWITMLAGRLACAMFVKKKHQKPVMMLCGLMMVLFFALMLSGQDVARIALAVGGLGLSMSGVCPMIYSDAAAYCNGYRLANGFLLGFGAVGSVMMPTLVGTLADHYGFETGMTTVLAAIVAFAVFALINAVAGRLGKHARA